MGTKPQDSLENVPPNRRQFVRFIQERNFCVILGLVVRHGGPVLDPMPKVIRLVKFPGPSGPRPEVASEDFALKKEMLEFFQYLDRLKDGRIARLEIRDGLPFRMEVEELAQP